MVVQLRRQGNEFSFVLPPQSVEDLSLMDGSTVDIQPAPAAAPAIRYATAEKVLEAHRRIEPQFAQAYRDLAK